MCLICCQVLWDISSWSESAKFLARLTEKSISGWGLFWKRSPVGSWFPKSLLREDPGTVPEHVRTIWFGRILDRKSSLDRSPKVRDSVRPKSWDSFLVTLLSISFETWVMYSSVIPGTYGFCDWLLLALSCVSLETADNFRLFFSVAIILEEGKTQQLRGLNGLSVFKWIVFCNGNLTLFFKKEMVPKITTVKMDEKRKISLQQY